MQVPPGCSVSLRVKRVLSNPELFARFILGRAATEGFPVTPARAIQIATVLKASAPTDLPPDEAYTYYKDVFKAFLAQDPALSDRFDRFWDDLWWYCPQGASGSNVTLGGQIGSDIAQKIAQALSGQINIPTEVILK